MRGNVRMNITPSEPNREMTATAERVGVTNAGS